MRCEICGKEISDYEITEIQYRPFKGNPHYSTYDYTCSDCLMKIKQFINWITKPTNY